MASPTIIYISVSAYTTHFSINFNKFWTTAIPCCKQSLIKGKSDQTLPTPIGRHFEFVQFIENITYKHKLKKKI